jgi:lipopolysaccharide export system permease protein
MRTVRSLLYRDIAASVGFVALAFLSLFFFIDIVDDLDQVGSRGRTVWHVVLAAAYALPNHFYELIPIALLIGCIYSLSSLAQTSQFTILRTSGLGPGRALALLSVPGVIAGVLTFAVGDYLAPLAERQAVALKAHFAGGLEIGGAGAWLRERRSTPEGERQVSVNVQSIRGDGSLQAVRIFVFDPDGALVERVQAARAEVGNGQWTLFDAESARWPRAREATAAGIALQRHEALVWPTGLDARVVAAAVLPLKSMTTTELWRYTRHLGEQEQAAAQHEIRFWKKALYPLACLVMVALALPFAYMHARAGGVSLKVFGGIMLGIAFVLMNNLAGHLGLLRDWTPWIAAATPGLVFLLLSLAAFTWLVRYR